MGKRAPATVLGLGFGLAVLLFVVLALVARQRGEERSSTVQLQAQLAPAQLASTSSDALAPASAALGSSAERAAVAAETSAARNAVAMPADEPASLVGRVELDGAALPAGTRVHYRCGEPTAEDHPVEAHPAEGWVALDRDGRFSIQGLAPGKLTLEFALSSPNRRQLLLPVEQLQLAPGSTTELPLRWRSKQVNLHVTGDLGGWNRARVRLTGAGYDAEFDTDDNGKAELTLIASGTLAFEATQRSGRRGATTLELEEDADLESVVIELDERLAR